MFKAFIADGACTYYGIYINFLVYFSDNFLHLFYYNDSVNLIQFSIRSVIHNDFNITYTNNIYATLVLCNFNVEKIVLDLVLSMKLRLIIL
jgi:hypothetical protein